MVGTIVLLAFIASSEVFGHNIEQVGCEFKAISKEYTTSCKKTYVEDIFKNVLNDGIIRENELLEQLSSTCSNYESYSKCANCTARHVCPEERTRFIESLSEKWSLFCDADQPAEWLTTKKQDFGHSIHYISLLLYRFGKYRFLVTIFLTFDHGLHNLPRSSKHNGYSYNTSCDYVYQDAFFSCLRVVEEKDSNSTSLTHVLEGYRSFIAETFKCTVGGILSVWEGGRQCGSSWQDILLTRWLKISAEYDFGININADEVKMLEAMRC